MKKIGLILLLVLGMSLSFAAIALVMLFATGVVDSIDGARELLMGETPGGESAFLKSGEVMQVQDALLLLQQQKQELETNLNQLRDAQQTLQAVRDSLSGEVAAAAQQAQSGSQSEAEERAKRLDQLVTLYSAMRPADAAGIFDNMQDDALILDILPRLKDRQAARILNALADPARKARLTRALVEGRAAAGP